MKTKFESLNAEKFNALNVAQHQSVRGGDPTASSGKGTITFHNKTYDYDGDIKFDDGGVNYWIPSLRGYLMVY